MDEAPIQIGQYILGKNLGIGAFGKVRCIVSSTVAPSLRPGLFEC